MLIRFIRNRDLKTNVRRVELIKQGEVLVFGLESLQRLNRLCAWNYTRVEHHEHQQIITLADKHTNVLMDNQNQQECKTTNQHND